LKHRFHFSRNLQRILAFTFIGIILIALFLLGMHSLPTENFQISVETQAIIQPTLQKQQEIAKDIQALYASGNYPFENPLVLQNPFGSAPLTALVIFDTPEAAQISVHVPGKTTQADVDFTFKGYTRHHEIPVYGLYADQTNQVTLTEKNHAGQEKSTLIPIKTEPLPVFLDSIQVVQADPNSYSPGMNFAFQDRKMVFDINGDVRWFSTTASLQTFLRLKNGNYLFTYEVADQPNNVIMEEDLLGKIYSVYNLPGGVQHDFIELPNGNLLVTSEDPGSEYVDDFIVELDRKSGIITRSFDLKKSLQADRPSVIGSDPIDWLHINSIVYDERDHSIIISTRNQAAIFKLSYPDMKIQWILGAHDNWYAYNQQYLLNPIGDDLEWPWVQHHATILSQETIDGKSYLTLLVFDNGLYRSFNPDTAMKLEDSYSRMVVYRINETDHTVEQIWEYGKARGSAILSILRGSAYLLSNGNFLGNWSTIVKNADGTPSLEQDNPANTSRTIEVNPANNQVVFEVVMQPGWNYRTARASLYEDYSKSNSSLEQNTNNTTPITLSKKVISGLQPLKSDLDRIEGSTRSFFKSTLMQMGLWQYLH
jgi:arylsulfate sulfotransferase